MAHTTLTTEPGALATAAAVQRGEATPLASLRPGSLESECMARTMHRFARWHVWLGRLRGVPLLLWRGRGRGRGLVLVARLIERRAHHPSPGFRQSLAIWQEKDSHHRTEDVLAGLALVGTLLWHALVFQHRDARATGREPL